MVLQLSLNLEDKNVGSFSVKRNLTVDIEVGPRINITVPNKIEMNNI
jgi:hypothetical protein